MKTAAIYCRVSTEDQEREGTSLQTQLEACLNHCRDKGYDVAYRFSEAYSGLSLERPELGKLRELIRAEQVDVIVVYCLDRLSRDPTHGVIITQELEKHRGTLEAVIEDIDNTELGKLISYIRGYASKVEAEKIKERTMRGKRAKAREGRISGGFHTTYGYDYIKAIRGERQAERVINETEAAWVKQIFEWLANEGLSTSTITLRLRALNAPTKLGNTWNRRSVQGILKNPSYTGKTYAFSQRLTRPQAEWIEIPDVTPTIISQELFEAAQKQLQVNRTKTMPKTRHQYLLRGHLRCRQCGQTYVGTVSCSRHPQRYYRCTGKLKLTTLPTRCSNKSWSADKLEGLVWSELQHYLSNRDLIAGELDRQRQDANQLGVYNAELQQVDRNLRTVDRDQHQLLQWALKGFPADQVEAENRRLNKARETLKARKAELEAQIKASQEAAINVPDLERFIEDIQDKLPSLDFEGKRLALEMLNITVWLDGQGIEITGTIEPEKRVLRCTHTPGCATGYAGRCQR